METKGKDDVATLSFTINGVSRNGMSGEHRIGHLLTINMADLSGELAEQPGLYAYYSALASHAADKSDRIKLELKVLESEVEMDLRKKYIKAPAQRVLEIEVSMDSRVKAKREEYLQSIHEQRITSNAAKAFEQRLQSLIAIGAMQRAEYRGVDPVIRAANPGATADFNRGLNAAKSETVRAQSARSMEETEAFLADEKERDANRPTPAKIGGKQQIY